LRLRRRSPPPPPERPLLLLCACGDGVGGECTGIKGSGRKAAAEDAELRVLSSLEAASQVKMPWCHWLRQSVAVQQKEKSARQIRGQDRRSSIVFDQIQQEKKVRAAIGHPKLQPPRLRLWAFGG
jgi:hypothetical protein